MAALLKTCLLIAFIASVLAGALNVPASAQQAVATQSRIHPSGADGVSPPSPAIATGSASRPSSSQPQTFDAAPTETIVDSLRLCQAAVSPQFDIRPQVFVDDGWAYTEPRRREGNGISYESVIYFKDPLTVGLLDFGPVVACRIVVRLRSTEQLIEIRASMARAFDAHPVRDAPNMQGYLASLSSQATASQIDNIVVMGNYVAEFSIQHVDFSRRGVPDLRDAIVLTATVNPLPAQFQSAPLIATP